MRPDEQLLPPIEAYDAFAPYYKSYADGRRGYLRRVNDIVISRAGPAASLLDVGAGDGSRALRIGQAAGIRRIVLLEPSAGMRAHCPDDAEVWPWTVLEIPDTAPRFEVITCLWNVLGHLQGSQQRLRALARLRQLLAPSGMFFLDVSHKYNAASYGWRTILAGMARDFVSPSERNGDVVVSWNAGGQVIRTLGHVFTHAEMKGLFHSAGLKIVARWVIDYETGAECNMAFGGQLLYQLTAA